MVAVVALALVAGVGCRTGEDGPTTAARVTTVPDAKVAARWERVTRFAGTGDERPAGFDIAAGALQWRVTLACEDGVVEVGLEDETSALARIERCPGNTFGFSIRTGPVTLAIEATGSWEVLVDQQLDTPVEEPVLAGMTDATRLATGEFYGIDQKGSGTATLYRLPGDGGGALRLDPFLVTRNSDLFVWVSEADGPRTSEEALHSPHVQIDRLTATAGAQNYVLPETVDLDRVRSVIVWCEPVQTAYAAASLERTT